ncbi:hypothetical protein TrVE_jg11414 [Triparma verrucosa]|uniref:FXYD domain-containing ion transport regulator n=2 Tax=Triparma TaxID=722752 RepID=A0A9W7DZD0_9STRA|nr:hypothetical protein TrST_g4138 [Triparma strigata]GMI08945.1 hypothetical protein TrVE_jg11414 [Triparma verrucosa]
MQALVIFFACFLAAVQADVIPEEDSKFDQTYTEIILWSLFASILFFVCGAAIRRKCTIDKGRTDRGVITSMLLPEDEVL